MAYENGLGSGCGQFEEKLVAYYFGDCSASESSWLEEHFGNCPSCRRFLEDLRNVLPKTVTAKEFPDSYWEAYHAEMIGKLDVADRRSSRWSDFFSFPRPWTVPAVGTALILILAVTALVTKGIWRSSGSPPKEVVPQEILADPGKIDFFRAMDLIESLELLESLERKSSARNHVGSL